MRILTVRQPWAWAIIHGGKNVENRVRNIAGDYRGPVAIHVALADAENAPESLWLQHSGWYRARTSQPKKFEPAWSDRGYIIGVVDLVDVHSASVIGGCGRMQNDCDEHPFGCRHHCSTWAMGPAPEGWYQHLVFENPRALDEPILYKGTLGLRRLDDDMIARINRELS
ncbi:hypothetical protein [Microbacterium sp. H6]|uniref:hypothetical protein n=1 Tax=Microbacterium sp. H6 TaxID=421122 RepID=UPI000DE1D97C|nr:hypothetical protein [Microbacterium sp. H6]RBO72833.1 hypothetical protein DSP71_08895 [Microbacterium sp. H6]